MRPILNHLNQVFKGLIHKCPYGPGYVRIVNASHDTEYVNELAKTQVFPNGYYKVVWIMFNDADANIMSGEWYIECNYRINVLNFNDRF